MIALMDEDKKDKVLEEVFRQVNYKEAEPLYGQLNELFLSLTSQIEIEIPEKASSGDVLATVEKQLDVWDDKIAQNQEASYRDVSWTGSPSNQNP